jgi:hypothetical protein
MRNSIILFFLLLTTGFSAQAQKIANYGIEGWAAYTLGGRGGRIIRVTNLNATGKGSFYEAISATGSRIIVFEVGGVIDFKGSSKTIKNPYVTIAGQTAPGKGITIINGGLYVQTHDVIIQHLRIRPGATGHEVGKWEPDAFSTNGAYNVIIDHCSTSWAVDENCSASGERFKGATPDEWRQSTSHTVTISNNIISEGLSNATHTKGEHSKGTLVHDNTSEIAILNNLYASNKDRNPLFKGGARGVVVNNFINNPGSSVISFSLVDGEWEGYEKQAGYMSIVGNYVQWGPSTSVPFYLFRITNGPCEIYMKDNLSEKKSGGVAIDEFKGDTTKKVKYKPVWNDNIHVVPAVDVQKNIEKNAGARPWDRDETDARIIYEMTSRDGKIINNETEVGGYPSFPLTKNSFIDEEWNLDYMLKISPDIALLYPENGRQFLKDSTITVESAINSAKNSIKSLELAVNGVSKGKIFQPPYKWVFKTDTTGDYDLIVVADADSMMKMSTRTIKITVKNPVSSLKKANSTNSLSVSAYPDLLSHKVNISYNLARHGLVRLMIFNSVGQQIETLVSESQTEGYHKVEWDTKGMPKGIYIYCLNAGVECLSNKIIIN